MTIFGKLKGAKKAADQHKAQVKAPAEADSSKPRYVHIPTHAARDAALAAPAGARGGDREAIASANKARLSRIGPEYSFYNPRSPNPKMARTPSAMSMDWSAYAISSESSSTQSRPLSYQSIPKSVQGSPPVPAIPAQYASQSVSPSIGSDSRNSSFQNHLAASAGPRPKTTRPQSMGASPLVSSTPDRERNSSSSSTNSDMLEIPVQASPQYQQPALKSNNDRKYFGHTVVAAAVEPVATVPAPAAPSKKTKRFSFLKRSSQAVAAY